MNLVLFADKDVGMNIAEYLIGQYREDVLLVVTTGENRISDLARSVGIATSVFESERQIMADLSGGVDLGVLAWWPRILKKPLIGLPRHGFINTHPSLLPYNRGKFPNFWALVEQSPFGVTLHRVDADIDTGEIVAQSEIPYDWEDTGGSLYFKAQEAMLTLFRESYPTLRSGAIHSSPQNNEQYSSHHSSEIDVASKIDLERLYRARDFLNLLRARTFQGKPGCWFEDHGEHFEISIDIRKIPK